jgi:hypothetical protein
LECILRNLRQSRNQGLLLEIERNQRSREFQERQFHVAEIEERKRQAFTIMGTIMPASSDIDQWKSANRWKSIPSSGKWLLEHEFVSAWMQADRALKFLWLKGIPGAGELAYAA